MKYQAVLFDLDGTLADTLEDIAAAGNHALTQLGRQPIATADYRDLVGHGVVWLIQRALGPGCDDLVPQGVTLFRSFYAEHGLAHTRPFAGVPELLDALTARQIILGVLSNKPDPATKQVVCHLFGRWDFQVVRGQLPGVPVKPHPAAALDIAHKSGIPAERWLYVGDSGVDVDTATNAGMHSVGVTWGFRPLAELREHGARYIINRPDELLDLLR